MAPKNVEIKMGIIKGTTEMYRVVKIWTMVFWWYQCLRLLQWCSPKTGTLWCHRSNFSNFNCQDSYIFRCLT
jgi:hypothetical protein